MNLHDVSRHARTGRAVAPEGDIRVREAQLDGRPPRLAVGP